jgi:hypothetical protein
MHPGLRTAFFIQGEKLLDGPTLATSALLVKAWVLPEALLIAEPGRWTQHISLPDYKILGLSRGATPDPKWQFSTGSRRPEKRAQYEGKHKTGKEEAKFLMLIRIVRLSNDEASFQVAAVLLRPLSWLVSAI